MGSPRPSSGPRICCQTWCCPSCSLGVPTKNASYSSLVSISGHHQCFPISLTAHWTCGSNSQTATHYFPLSRVLLCSTFFSPHALTLLGVFSGHQQGTRKTARAPTRGHLNRDKLQVDILHASSCSCSQGTRWISQSQNPKCIPFTRQALARSGLRSGS